MKDPIKKLVFNMLLDLRKEKLDKRHRAQLLQEYIEDNNISQRALAKELGIPHSTIQDWLMISRISDKKYQEYINQGLNDTDIYRMLRNNKKSSESDLDSLVIVEQVKKSISKYKGLINYSKNLDNHAIGEIKQLINVLNRIIIHNERPRL